MTPRSGWCKCTCICACVGDKHIKRARERESARTKKKGKESVRVHVCVHVCVRACSCLAYTDTHCSTERQGKRERECVCERLATCVHPYVGVFCVRAVRPRLWEDEPGHKIPHPCKHVIRTVPAGAPCAPESSQLPGRGRLDRRLHCFLHTPGSAFR